MESLLSLLVIAGLFFLMMRHGHGCGAHAHGGHQAAGHKDDTRARHIDPVCGTTVDPQQGYGRMFEGRLHRFCSKACLDRFDDNPGRYVATETKAIEK